MITRVIIAACVAACTVSVTACSGSSPIIPKSNPPIQSVKSASVPQKPIASESSLPKGSWLDWPITDGIWVYRADGRGSIALFGDVQSDALITLRCDLPAKRIYLARAANIGSGAITVRTSSALKTFAAAPTGGAAAYIAAEIMPSDPFLDAIIFTRGRIALEGKGQSSIAIPIWSEFAKVVEDCRA